MCAVKKKGNTDKRLKSGFFCMFLFGWFAWVLGVF